MQHDFTFWGHNCFLVETENEALLIDPWLNDTGAFFGSWHQWPPNSHLRDTVAQRCQDKSLSIFLSHEHMDHFDKETLRGFASHPRCTVFVPEYKDKYLFDSVRNMNLHAVELADAEEVGQQIRFRIFIDDSGVNHDSAIFVAAPGLTFLNQNDCKLFDRLPRLVRELGPIDYYSVQYSGANWHPDRFEMPPDQRLQAAKKKVQSKFRNVRDAIRLLAPRFYLPAAGPAFFPFLDPILNAGAGTIFVHQDELAKFLTQNSITNVMYPRPGDRIAEDSSRLPIPAPTAGELEHYRSTHRNVWEDIEDVFSKDRFAELLQRRLDAIADVTLPPCTPPIAFTWGSSDADWLVVDLANKALGYSRQDHAPCITLAASTRYFSLMCGDHRWQDVALSLRATLCRVPDVYNTAANIFLFADESNLRTSLLYHVNLSNERVVVDHRGEQYEINRYCPHQGGDLAYAAIDDDLNLVCPRHSWRFDLQSEGLCKTSGMTIKAVKLKG